jgi:Tol biopolymer transport system component/DNA-binding winged helix-turn-helix (wHTH) protein
VEQHSPPAGQAVRFGAFEVDLQAGELRKDGVRLKLSGQQPFQVLAILLERPGQIVTREELRSRLWPDTFVDFDHSLNSAINRIRELLGDSSESPQFVETLPRRGYRFIAPVEVRNAPAEDAAARAPALPPKRSATVMVVAIGACVLLGFAGFLVFKGVHGNVPAEAVQHSLTRVTFDEGLQIGSTWSPDDRYIAYSSDRGGKSDIWVQQVSGGNPVQITKGSGQNWQPDWSPDGNFIAYRSEEGDGGIYVIPALGGAGLERKIASFGFYPRWSPDGSQILIQSQFTPYADSDRFYVVQLDGSPPREVLADFIAQHGLWARTANWHPDGKRITIWVGDSSPSPIFWTVPIAGGPGVKLEISAAVQRELTHASGEGESGQQLGEWAFSWSPSGDAVCFERGFRGARNIWEMTVDPGTMRATGIARLTTGPGPDAGLAVSRDGKRLAFTAKSQQIRSWLFPFDSTAGQIKGNGYAISSPGRTSLEPTLSRDGTKVAYFVPHGESYGFAWVDVRNEVWVKSLVDGSETPLIGDDGYSRWFPQWSPDGMQLAYERRNRRTNERQLVVWSSQNHEEESLTTLNPPFRVPWDWSSDGKWLMCASERDIWLVPVASAPHAETTARKITTSDPEYRIYRPHISPNLRWIVFEAVTTSANPHATLFVVPASGGPWRRITDGKHRDGKAGWSPDGKTIYFVSEHDGFFNVWGIHFDPSAGRAVGQPFQVSKFESPHPMFPRWIGGVGLSVTPDKLVLTMAEESGNIWVLDNVDR